jgi:ATP-binding cassette subfamily B protein
MTTSSRFAVFRERPEVQLFAVRPRVHRGLAVSWWLLVLVSGLLPAGFAVLTGSVVAAVGGQRSLRGPLSAVGVVFVGMVPVPPLLTAVSQNLASTRR